RRIQSNMILRCSVLEWGNGPRTADHGPPSVDGLLVRNSGEARAPWLLSPVDVISDITRFPDAVEGLHEHEGVCMSHDRTLGQSLSKAFVNMTRFELVSEPILAVHVDGLRRFVSDHNLYSSQCVVESISHDNAPLGSGNHGFYRRIGCEGGRQHSQSTSCKLHGHDALLINTALIRRDKCVNVRGLSENRLCDEYGIYAYVEERPSSEQWIIQTLGTRFLRFETKISLNHFYLANLS